MALFCPLELAVRRVTVDRSQMVFLRSLLEANEGLGFIVAESGGEAYVMSSMSQKRELDLFLADVAQEISLRVWQEFSQSELEQLAR